LSGSVRSWGRIRNRPKRYGRRSIEAGRLKPSEKKFDRVRYQKLAEAGLHPGRKASERRDLDLRREKRARRKVDPNQGGSPQGFAESGSSSGRGSSPCSGSRTPSGSKGLLRRRPSPESDPPGRKAGTSWNPSHPGSTQQAGGMETGRGSSSSRSPSFPRRKDSGASIPLAERSS